LLNRSPPVTPDVFLFPSASTSEVLSQSGCGSLASNDEKKSVSAGADGAATAEVGITRLAVTTAKATRRGSPRMCACAMSCTPPPGCTGADAHVRPRVTPE
jgi:hypothetical protein